VDHRGHEVQRAAHRRPGARSASVPSSRSTDADPRELPAVLPGDGAACREQRAQRQEQVVLRHGRRRRPRWRRRGRDHRPGRALRRVVGLRQGRTG
jgi:hypothetical protein